MLIFWYRSHLLLWMILLALALKLLSWVFLSFLSFQHAISQVSYEKWKCTAQTRGAENSCTFMVIRFHLIHVNSYENRFLVESNDFLRTEPLADIPINWILAPRFPPKVLAVGESKKQAFLLFWNQAFLVFKESLCICLAVYQNRSSKWTMFQAKSLNCRGVWGLIAKCQCYMIMVQFVAKPRLTLY